MCHSPSTLMPDGNDGRWYGRFRTEIHRGPVQRSVIILIARAEGSLGSRDMDMLHTKCPPWSDMKPLRGSQKFQAGGQPSVLERKLLDVIWKESVWDKISCTVVVLSHDCIWIFWVFRLDFAFCETMLVCSSYPHERGDI